MSGPGLGDSWAFYKDERGRRRPHKAFAVLLLVGLLLTVIGPTMAFADGSPTISSDKSDYSPGDTVVLTGSNWQPAESVHIDVNDDQAKTWEYTSDVTADDAGNITDTFVLPDRFIASYAVTATGALSGSATIAFTDAPLSYAPSTQTLSASPGGSTATFTQQVTAASGSGTFTASLVVAGGATPIPASWVSTAPTSLSFSATATNDVKSWTVNFTVPLSAACGTYTANVKADPSITGIGQGPGTNVTLNVTGCVTNHAPVATNDSYSTDEDTNLNVTAPGVLGNDTDADGDALHAALVAGPSHGTLNLSADGSFTYNPNSNFNGSDSFTYRANDGTSNSNTATVSITVNAVDDAPVATNDSYLTDEDTNLNVTAPGILGNDTDVENNSLTAILGSGPSHGTLTLNADGSFTYNPNSNFNGSDSFTYKANDGTANGNVATVDITVNAVNDAPVVSLDGSASTTEGQAEAFTITTTDVDSSSFSLVSVDCGTNGSESAQLFDTGTGSGSFKCTWSDNGSTSVTVVVGDNDGGSDSESTPVTIDNVAPTASFTDDQTVSEGTSGFVFALTSSSDPSTADTSAGLRYSLSCDGNGLASTYAAAGATSSTTCSFADGPATVTVKGRIFDKDDGYTTYTSTVTVNNVAPSIAISGNASVDEGSAYSLTLGAVTDPGADTVTSYVVHWGDGGSDTYSGTGVKTHTYADGPNSYNVTVDLTDEDGTFTDVANSLVVQVNDVKPTVAIDSLTGAGATACLSGNTVTLGFSWTDPAGTNDVYSYDVNWGDGTLHASSAAATSPVTGLTHTYSPGGPYTVTVTVNDGDPGAGGSVSSSAFSILYSATGVLQPVNDTQAKQDPSVFKYGSTIPVKIKVTDCSGANVSTLSPQISVKKISGSTPLTAVDENITSTSGADSGTTMRFDPTAGQYIYNLATKSLSDSTATYQITITGPFVAVTTLIGTRAK